MAKPRLIIVVRHAQSEGNKKREIHQTVPDHRVKLTPEGVAQARDAGRRLRNLLRPDDTLHFFTSPYRRTRETTEGILETLTSDDPAPSPFRRSNIKVYEEPRLREQDFGNFQPCSDEMERMWQERADYGHFFYRIPNGESAADAYDRVSGFNESLWRQFGEDSFASVCVLVTHGLMSRVFLMKWYHFSVEYFEDLRNVNHCEFLIMRKQDNGKYLLENNLRTWSQLRRERAAKDGTAPAPAPGRIERSRTLTIPRRWGGCPNGCDHSRHYKLREDLEVLRQKDVEHALAGVGNSGAAGAASASQAVITTVATTTAAVVRTSSSPGTSSRRSRLLRTISSDDEDYDDDGDDDDRSGEDNPSAKPPAKAVFSNLDASRTRTFQVDEPLSSPEVILQHPRHIHVGRDFGGAYSANTSAAGSDTDPPSEDDRRRRRRLAPQEARARAKAASTLRRQTPTGDDGDGDGDGDTSAHEQYHQPPPPTRLGDMPPEDGGDDADVDAYPPEDIDKAEKEDRSLTGSVY